MNINRQKLKILIKESMEELQQDDLRDSPDTMEAENVQEMSWAKVLDAIHPQKEENHQTFRGLMVQALSEANAENEEFLLDLLENLASDTEIQTIIMHHFESSFKQRQEV
jgi:hypothetical protein